MPYGTAAKAGGKMRRAWGAVTGAAGKTGRGVKKAGSYTWEKTKAGYRGATKGKRKYVTGGVLGAAAAGGGYAVYRKKKRSRSSKRK